MHTLSSLREGKLAGITRLDLSCGLNSFPDEIFSLAGSLEILNLSGNALKTLPDDLVRLHKLKVIFCSENKFEDVPEVLGQCPNLEMVGFKSNQISTMSHASLPEKLRWLILTGNRLPALPKEIGACSELQKLMLSGNRLDSLPEEMSACSRLELLRIASNKFENLPAWLLTLPNLSWLAYAGNPCSDRVELDQMPNEKTAQIHWKNIDLQHKLGEGASGIIYCAENLNRKDEKPFAVKIFKGALTSDGLPRSEKAACLAAGAHAGLIPVIGKLIGHPEGTPGLVMQLIDESYINLAGPPSLESCTKDIYPADAKFSMALLLKMALGVSEVIEHLHARGLMHGDLYAHNILWNKRGDCLLGDFGAATFLPRQEESMSTGLKKIEVRAFSCLLDELLIRCEAKTESADILVDLRALQERCNQSEIATRPFFDEITDTLRSLQAMYMARSATNQ